MKRVIKFFTLLMLAGSHVACSGSLENVKVTGVRSVTYTEFEGTRLMLDVEVVVDNPNRWRVTVKDAQMSLFFGDDEIGTATQMEPVRLAAHSHESHLLKIAVQLNRQQPNLMKLYRLLMNQTGRLSLSGSLRVKAFLFSKTLKVDKLLFQ